MRRQYRRRRTGPIAQAAAIWAVLGLITVPTAIYAYMHRSPRLDADGCVAGVDPPQAVSVFLDATDAYPPAAVRQVVEGEMRALPRGGKLQIWVLGERQGIFISPEVSLCRPGDAITADVMSENARKLEAEFQSRVLTRLRAVVDGHALGHASTSAIFESVAHVARHLPRADRQRLVVISDLLESSAATVNMYGGKPLVWSQLQPSLPPQAMANLRGAEVDIYLLPARGAELRIQRKAWFATFWTTYFNAAGAARTDFKPLPAPSAG